MKGKCMGLKFTGDGLDNFGYKVTGYLEDWSGLNVCGFVEIRRDLGLRNTYYMEMSIKCGNTVEMVGKLNRELGVGGFEYVDGKYRCKMTREDLRRMDTLFRVLGVEDY